MVPPCSTPGRLAILHKKKNPVHTCWAGQGDSHQDTQIYYMYTEHFCESLHTSEVESTWFWFLHSFVRTGGPFPSAFSAPGAAGKSPVTAHNGIEVILAFVRANELV